jgi:RND family efflux transporter MFP subunit
VAPVVNRAVDSTRPVVGTVQPARRSEIGSAVDGRVIEFLVENGDRVSAGAQLAQLRTDTLELERRGAQAELTLREQELAELKNGTDEETIANLAARMKSVDARLGYQKAQLERVQSLFQQGKAASQNELDEAVSASLAAENDYLAVKALHDLAIRGPRQEKIAQAEARVAIQQEAVRVLDEQIARHAIVAPFDGFVVAEHTEVGQWVARGGLIAEVIQLSEVDVVVHVLEDEIPRLKVGQKATLEVPSATRKEWSGTVRRIIPQADARARTLPVEVRVTNQIEDGVPVLKAGVLARVHLPTGRKQQSLMVPKDALVLGGVQTLVYVLQQPDGNSNETTVRAVPVTLGVSDGQQIQVTGNLSEGDRVVVQGNERLKSGQAVSVLKELSFDNRSPDAAEAPDSAGREST